jgi:hypothetical protein
MAVTEGAGSSSDSDPVLESALSEMVSEGTVDLASNFDPGPESASQSSESVSSAAPKAAAPTPPTGDNGSIQAGSSSVPKTGGTPSAASAAADPLAGTEPVPYTVNGEARTLAWGHRVPGEGVFLTEAEMPQLQSLAERADILDRVTRDLTDQNTVYERLSQWPSIDSEGKSVTLSGQQGLEAMRVENARKDGLISVMDAILTDPAKLLSLLAKDGQGNIVVDPDAIGNLTMRAQLTADQSERVARAQFSKAQSPVQTPPAGPNDYTSKAPKVIEQAAGANFAALLPEDKTMLANQIGRYVRTVTEEDRRWNPSLKVGGPIVDAAYEQVVQHLATQRAAAKTQATAAEAAGKFNGGMDRNRQPARQPAKAPPAQPPKTEDGRKPKADWESPSNTALAEMGVER